jgi:hypothetical protein
MAKPYPPARWRPQRLIGVTDRRIKSHRVRTAGATIRVQEVTMTIEINEREQTGEAPELPGIILLIVLVTILAAICWLSL